MHTSVRLIDGSLVAFDQRPKMAHEWVLHTSIHKEGPFTEPRNKKHTFVQCTCISNPYLLAMPIWLVDINQVLTLATALNLI